MNTANKRYFRVSRNSWGAQAERKVFRILRELGENFAVLNDMDARYGNIDHVVIRKNGTVFLIETKSHRGRVTVRGGQILLDGQPFKRNVIAQINRNIIWLREFINARIGFKPWIVAVVVFRNALVCSPKGQRVLHLGPANSINVIDVKWLRRTLEQYPSEKETSNPIWNNLDRLG